MGKTFFTILIFSLNNFIVNKFSQNKGKSFDSEKFYTITDKIYIILIFSDISTQAGFKL